MKCSVLLLLALTYQCDSLGADSDEAAERLIHMDRLAAVSRAQAAFTNPDAFSCIADWAPQHRADRDLVITTCMHCNRTRQWGVASEHEMCLTRGRAMSDALSVYAPQSLTKTHITDATEYLKKEAHPAVWFRIEQGGVSDFRVLNQGAEVSLAQILSFLALSEKVGAFRVNQTFEFVALLTDACAGGELMGLPFITNGNSACKGGHITVPIAPWSNEVKGDTKDPPWEELANTAIHDSVGSSLCHYHAAVLGRLQVIQHTQVSLHCDAQDCETKIQELSQRGVIPSVEDNVCEAVCVSSSGSSSALGHKYLLAIEDELEQFLSQPGVAVSFGSPHFQFSQETIPFVHYVDTAGDMQKVPKAYNTVLSWLRANDDIAKNISHTASLHAMHYTTLSKVRSLQLFSALYNTKWKKDTPEPIAHPFNCSNLGTILGEQVPDIDWSEWYENGCGKGSVLPHIWPGFHRKSRASFSVDFPPKPKPAMPKRSVKFAPFDSIKQDENVRVNNVPHQKMRERAVGAEPLEPMFQYHSDELIVYDVCNELSSEERIFGVRSPRSQCLHFGAEIASELSKWDGDSEVKTQFNTVSVQRLVARFDQEPTSYGVWVNIISGEIVNWRVVGQRTSDPTHLWHHLAFLALSQKRGAFSGRSFEFISLIHAGCKTDPLPQNEALRYPPILAQSKSMQKCPHRILVPVTPWPIEAKKQIKAEWSSLEKVAVCHAEYNHPRRILLAVLGASGVFRFNAKFGVECAPRDGGEQRGVMCRKDVQEMRRLEYVSEAVQDAACDAACGAAVNTTSAKYIITTDGVDAVGMSRFHEAFSQRGVVIGIDSDFVQYYGHAVLPFVHYIPVSKNPKKMEKSLSAAMHYLHNNDNIAKDISDSAAAFHTAHLNTQSKVRYFELFSALFASRWDQGSDKQRKTPPPGEGHLNCSSLPFFYDRTAATSEESADQKRWFSLSCGKRSVGEPLTQRYAKQAGSYLPGYTYRKGRQFYSEEVRSLEGTPTAIPPTPTPLPTERVVLKQSGVVLGRLGGGGGVPRKGSVSGPSSPALLVVRRGVVVTDAEAEGEESTEVRAMKLMWFLVAVVAARHLPRRLLVALSVASCAVVAAEYIRSLYANGGK